MIIKSRTNIKAIVSELENMKSEVDPNRINELEEEIKRIKYGSKSEDDSAYLINFHYDNDRYAIIHDLRIVYNKEKSNQVAQIDHLVINRALQCFVFETKSVFGKLEINKEGEFIKYFEDKPFGIESPIEQNNRHIDVLRKYIDEKEELVPRSFGRKLKIDYRSVILISRSAIIKRPFRFIFDTSMLIKDDMVKTYLNKFDKVNKNSFNEKQLRKFAEKLAKEHQPIKINYRKRFGLDKEQSCDECSASINERVMQYCLERPERFGDRVYCMKCQKKYQVTS